MSASHQIVNLGRASRIQTLRPFPAVACHLMKLVNGATSVDFGEVSRALMADAAFSSQVLRVANSALFGARYEVKNILQALCVVGVDRLRDLVVTVALKDYVGRGDNLFLHRCWRHNLATALWCEALADHCHIDRPMGYTAGILHDIGRIALLMLFPDDYAAFLDVSLTGDLDKLEAERKLCDADHCQIGDYLAKSWNFPPVLGDVIAHHHDEVTSETPRMRLLVQAACTAASMSGFHAAGPAQKWDTARLELLLPQGSGPRPPCGELMERVAWKLNRTECSLL
jgi:putative nucleotidyltransferase with HDIG domain